MSNPINDGDQAFPSQPKWWDPDDMAYRDGDHMPGMSLRDYFAAKAMPFAVHVHSKGHVDGWLGIARTSYDIADAMLKARQS